MQEIVSKSWQANTEHRTVRWGQGLGGFFLWRTRKKISSATSPCLSCNFSLAVSHNKTCFYANTAAPNIALPRPPPNFVPPLQLPYYLANVWTSLLKVYFKLSSRPSNFSIYSYIQASGGKGKLHGNSLMWMEIA